MSMDMASIRKRLWKTSKGEPREAWIVDYFDQHGKRHVKTFARKKEADAWVVDAAHEVKRGTHTAHSTSVTVGEAGDRWADGAEAEGLARSTVKQYRNHMKHHIRPYLGTMKLSQLSAPMVRDFEDELRSDGRSDAMVRKVLSSLAMLIGDAQDRGLVAHNVVRERNRGRKKKPRNRRKIKAGVDFPLIEEARMIMEVAAGRWRPLVAAAVITGMRASELRGLTWNDVDFCNGIIHVRQRADEWGNIGNPKSDAGDRTIPMGDFLANTLKKWKLECPKGELSLVFPNGKGNVESHANIYRRCFGAIQSDCEIVKKTDKVDEEGEPIMVPKYGIHAFRHYAISTFIDMGYPPKRVQDIAGHSTLAMTMDTYGHLFPDPEGDADMMRRAELRLVS